MTARPEGEGKKRRWIVRTFQSTYRDRTSGETRQIFV
jgi:hypothetical protein